MGNKRRRKYVGYRHLASALLLGMGTTAALMTDTVVGVLIVAAGVGVSFSGPLLDKLEDIRRTIA